MQTSQFVYEMSSEPLVLKTWHPVQCSEVGLWGSDEGAHLIHELVF